MANEHDITELRRQIDAIWDYLKYKDQASKHRLEAELIRNDVNSLRNDLGDFLQKLNRETQTYIRIVTTVGYTGYFATWAFVKHFLEPNDARIVALSGLISLAIFCFWELFTAFVRLRSVSEFNHVLNNLVSVEDFERLKSEQKSKEARREAELIPVQAIAFWSTIGSIIFGGLYLLDALISQM